MLQEAELIFAKKGPKFTKSATSCFSPEMEFLDISYTKDSSLLLQASHIPYYWRILKKTILFSGFKNPYKKSSKQENSSLLMNCYYYLKCLLGLNRQFYNIFYGMTLQAR